MKAVILAAGLGTRLAPLTNDRPKCLVPVLGRAILDRMIERLGQAGIRDVIVVTGYFADAVKAHLAGSQDALARRAVTVFNPRYKDWGNFFSVLVAKQAIGDDDFVLLDGDVLLAAEIVPRLVAAPGPAALAIDCVECGDEEMKAVLDATGKVVNLSKKVNPKTAVGESIGVARLDRPVVPAFFQELEKLIAAGRTDEFYEAAYVNMMKQGTVFNVVEVTGLPWTEIDDRADLARAEELAGQQ